MPERFRGVAPSAPAPSAHAACRSLPPNLFGHCEMWHRLQFLQDESLDVPRRRGRRASGYGTDGLAMIDEAEAGGCRGQQLLT